MPPDPGRGPVRRAVSALDPRVEAATGHDVDTLWDHRDRGLLDEVQTLLADRHRALAQAETAVTFYRTLLHRLSNGEFPVDAPLFERIGRTVDQLEGAAAARDAAEHLVLAVLEPIEATARTAPSDSQAPLAAADQAALLAIARGAKLHQHLLTGQMSVATASGARVSYARLQQLEAGGLVSRDAGHPIHAGQPIDLTEAGRAALSRRTRPTAEPSATPARRPGAFPTHRR
ncbi:hypothetical protein LVX13_36655 [Streptomyces albulus]|uniref:hypothetical protein n=1 Tax=Streptomyces noursei TaxID=1971 RepID=UPI001F2330C3|nr:hypothetical protein [Streptomyces noursei]MCE4948580.1 hypothetical protein [Streptomyces noursei]